MRSIKVVGLAILAALALSALAAGQASAALHIYKVEGVELGAGATKEIKSSMKSAEFVLKGKGALGVETVTRCKKLKLNAAEKPVIVGGNPGKSEKEKIEFEECSATVGGAKCSGVEVENVLTNNELVSVVKPEKWAGRVASLFTPASGKVFSKIKFKSCGIFGSPSGEVEGTSAGLAEPKEKEEVKGWLVYGTGEKEITVIEKQSGATEKVELKTPQGKATLEGEAWVELVSGQKWGAF